MKTKYYRVQQPGNGAYGFRHDGTILAVRGDREWLLTDVWCGDGVEGECYRNHVNGHRRSWPKASDNAIDKTEIFDDLGYGVSFRDGGAKAIRKILNV